MFDFTKLWDKEYLIGPNPIELSRSDHIFFWVAAVFLAASVISKIAVLRTPRDSPRNLLFRKLFHLFLTIGLLKLLWTGTRFENIPWLSTHLVVLFLFLVWLFWLIYIGKWFIREYRRQQNIWNEEQVKLKYLKK